MEKNKTPLKYQNKLSLNPIFTEQQKQNALARGRTVVIYRLGLVSLFCTLRLHPLAVPRATHAPPNPKAQSIYFPGLVVVYIMCVTFRDKSDRLRC